ncbi:enoyl-CoA hydratase-related protein [Rhodopseudomonas palustris]
MSNTLILRDFRESIAVFTLNRPKALNALSAQLMAELSDALQAADENDAIRAVVIAGSERAFCAGADITSLDGISVGDVLDPHGFGRGMFDILGAYRKPLIAAVQGLAFGGGCELALACDIVVAGESARFGVPEVGLGLLPGGGGTQRLVHAMGKQKAMKMLLTGDPISAQDSFVAGLASELVPDAECLPRAIAIAERIARNAPLAVQLTKDSARGAMELGLPQGLALERRNFILLFGTADKQEGVLAFLEKRKPQFVGK